MFRFLAATVLLLFTLAPSAQAETIRLATLEWPPYISQRMQGQGYVAEVVRTAFARAGIDVELTFMPWKRTLEETRSGHFQAYVPEYFSQDLRKDFVFSAPFPGGPLVLLARRGSGIRYSTVRDLAPYRIGVVRGYVNTPEIDNATFMNKYAVMDDLTSLRMLVRERLDLSIMDLNVALYLARTHLGGTRDIEVLQPPLDNKLLYICFPLVRDDHLRLLTAFNAGLMDIEGDGTLEAIRNRHGFTQTSW
ncbi:MAG: transporter substrate-binding domain-containing protein [Proteobacteria bacterium]|nr:transporter substrate-binding domain-containing protein [Pseudomonadota bacterium]